MIILGNIKVGNIYKYNCGDETYILLVVKLLENVSNNHVTTKSLMLNGDNPGLTWWSFVAREIKDYEEIK